MSNDSAQKQQIKSEDALLNEQVQDILSNEDKCKQLGIDRESVQQQSILPTLDMCVQVGKLIRSKWIDRKVRFSGINGCRSGVVNLDHVVDCRIVVECAHESLAEDCRSVTVVVGLFIILVDANNDPVCGIRLNDIEITFDEFYELFTWKVVKDEDLEKALRIIDGSCIVIDLFCRWIPEENAARIRGWLVDKLWKHENVWVTGFAPYRDRITVKHEFKEGHEIDPCP